MQEIHWYPGHMAKAKRQLTELIKYLDLILEVRDARLPRGSHNSDLEALLARKPKLVILNKIDLAEPAVTKAWDQWFKKNNLNTVEVNGKSGKGIEDIWKMLSQIVPVQKRKSVFRVGVIGIPNVGKSSILNRLLGTGSAKTGNLPGVTRGKQWIKRNGFEILDTPGLLPPKIINQEDGLKLALIGTIREEIIPSYDLGLLLLGNYGEKLFEWGKNGFQIETAEEMLAWFARKRGFLIKGGELDLHRATSTLLKEFRDGRLGRISLELPPHDGTAG